MTRRDSGGGTVAMKSSEMIQELLKIMDMFGDVDVFVNGIEDDVEVTELFTDHYFDGTRGRLNGAFIATKDWPNTYRSSDE